MKDIKNLSQNAVGIVNEAGIARGFKNGNSVLG